MKYILSVISLIFILFSASGQELLFREFEKNAQLPSNECYNIVQDKHGYIWIATEEGLCRFSKGNLKVYNKKDGLPEKAVYASHCDKKGQLWFATSENRLLTVNGSQLQETALQQKHRSLIESRLLNATSFPHSFIEDANGTLYLSGGSCVEKISPDRKSISIIFGNSKTRGINYLITSKGCLVPIPSYPNYYKSNNIFVKRENGDVVYRYNVNKVSPYSYFNKTCIKGNLKVLTTDNILLKILNGKTIKEYKFPSRILSVKIDSKGGLWVGVWKSGLYYYPDPDNMSRRLHSLKGYSVSGLCEDYQNNIWCTTLEKGVLKCTNKSIIAYKAYPELLTRGTLLKYEKNKIFFSSSSTSIFSIDKDNTIRYEIPGKEITYYNDILGAANKFYIGAMESTLIWNLKENTFSHARHYHKPTNSEIQWGVAQMETRRNKTYCLSHYFLGYIEKNKICQIHGSKEINRCFLFINKNEVLIGGRKFLQIYNLDKKSATLIPNVKSEVRDIIKTKYGKLIVATRNDGLFYYDHNSQKLTPFDVELPDDVIIDLEEDIYGNIWCASNTGLLKLSKSAGKNYHLQRITTLDGLTSNKIYKVAATPKEIFFTNQEGLFSISLIARPKTVHLKKAILSYLSVNGTERSTDQNRLNLDHTQNNLKFKFDITCFNSDAHLEYLLSDKNTKGTFQTIQGRELLLSSLSPGKYTLAVFVKSKNNVSHRFPLKIYITVNPPFWLTFWFISCVVLLIIVVIALIAYAIVKRIQKKESEKTKLNMQLADYQMSALQAQMNPHFIFNAINTIQGYIISQNKDEAYNYLTQFSKLIRMVLHHSQEKNVPLDDELEMLRLYIELEQLRFDHCFDFVLDVGPEVEIHEAFIPSMILQPFIENAIWHGIINLKKSRHGLLKLSLSQEDDVLYIVLEDNGVGRKQAVQYNTSSHKSVALSVTSQRIEMLNKQDGNEDSGLNISDIYDEHGNPYGTRIEIRLPLQFN